MTVVKTGALVVGGGPAGLAPLVAGSRNGMLDRLLAGGLVVAERDRALGAGRLGRYLIHSDSSAETFLSCIAGHPDPRLASLLDHPAARALVPYGRQAVPLSLAADFLAALGTAMAEVIAAAPSGRILLDHEATSVRRVDGGWSTRLVCGHTATATEIISNTVLLGLGGHQPEARLAQQWVAGRPLASGCHGRLVQSDRVLTAIGLAEISCRLRTLRHPRIVVIGGSTSALSCVRVLMDSLGDRLSPGGITLMHRSPLKIWYPSAEAADQEGYEGYGPDDICPVSLMVHRFGGLRFSSRTLAMAALGIGNGEPDPRLRLHRLQDHAVDQAGVDTADPARSWQLLDEADLVVSALGYRPRLVPILGLDGEEIALRGQQAGGGLVGSRGGILDEFGRELPGLFGIGLAAGLRAGPDKGGEPSFSGQVNGLWLWQNDVGAMIAERMVEVAEAKWSPPPGRHDCMPMPIGAVPVAEALGIGALS